jgi:hypothetical protein
VTLPDLFLGPGFWKLGYVTNDRDAAIERLRDELGLEEWATHEPEFEIVLADGRSGSVRTSIAFTVGHHNAIELVEPVEGLVDPWADPLRGTSGPTLRFHHAGLLVDDIEAGKRAGLRPEVESAPGAPVPWIFYRPPLVDHYVEHMETASSGAWVASLVSRG